MRFALIGGHRQFSATIETRLAPPIKNSVDEMKRDGFICRDHPVTLLALPLTQAF